MTNRYWPRPKGRVRPTLLRNAPLSSRHVRLIVIRHNHDVELKDLVRLWASWLWVAGLLHGS
jgi:hypothetical protein